MLPLTSPAPGVENVLAGSKRLREDEGVRDSSPKRARRTPASTQQSQNSSRHTQREVHRLTDLWMELRYKDEVHKTSFLPFLANPESPDFDSISYEKMELWFWTRGIPYGGLFHVETPGPFNMKFRNAKEWMFVEAILTTSMGAYAEIDSWGRPMIKVRWE